MRWAIWGEEAAEVSGEAGESEDVEINFRR